MCIIINTEKKQTQTAYSIDAKERIFSMTNKNKTSYRTFLSLR